MKHILPFAAASLALATAHAAADQWVYDASARTLSRGSVVLQNVSASGTSLTIGNNQSNATAVGLDFSEGVADGYAVTAFASEAFKGNTALREVVLPDTLVALGGNATFRQCTALTNAVFQSGCSMGKLEFYSCTALRSVTLHPDMSGEWIGTFQNCTSLTGDIVLPRGVTGMKETFMNAKITSFETVSTNLVYIGYQTNGDGDFANCRTLTNIVLHAGLKTIGTRVFNNCTGLAEIVLPDTVETFTASFSSCSSLKRVVMPKNLATIGSRTFKGQPMEIYWRGYPKNDFTFGGTDTRDPMWDVYTANVVTNWIRIEDKASWAAAATAYPDYVSLPPEKPRGAAGWWKGGYRSSAKTVLRWWYGDPLLLLVK